MAILKSETQEIVLEDGSPIINAAEELGVCFGCRAGQCGTCRTKVIEGMENLCEKNEAEKEMNLEPDERLMCQAKIKSGTVKIKL